MYHRVVYFFGAPFKYGNQKNTAKAQTEWLNSLNVFKI